MLQWGKKKIHPIQCSCCIDPINTRHLRHACPAGTPWGGGGRWGLSMPVSCWDVGCSTPLPVVVVFFLHCPQQRNSRPPSIMHQEAETGCPVRPIRATHRLGRERAELVGVHVAVQLPLHHVAVVLDDRQIPARQGHCLIRRLCEKACQTFAPAGRRQDLRLRPLG